MLDRLLVLLAVVVIIGLCIALQVLRERSHRTRILKMLGRGDPDNEVLGDILTELPAKRLYPNVPVLGCRIGDYRVEIGSNPPDNVDAVLETVRIELDERCLLRLCRPRELSTKWTVNHDSLGEHRTDFLAQLQSYCGTVPQNS